MPTLNFKGKSAVWNHHLSVPYHTLEKDAKKSLKGANDGENLIIHGDNLLALKALLPQYQGKVRCIYIDPPYNTGNEGWVYSDNVSSPTIKEWVGKVVGKEGEDLTRHDKWLCMMTPRLKMLRELLAEDGAIFISIDDNEVHHLRMLMDAVFGEENFVADFSWIRKKKGAFLSKKTRKMLEYVLCYQKTKNNLEFFGEKAYADKWQPIVKRTNQEKELTFPANSILTTLADGLYNKGKFSEGETAVEFLNDFTVEEGVVIGQLKTKGRYVWTQDFLAQELKDGSQVSLSKKFGFNVLRADQAEKFKAPSNLISKEVGVGTNEDATSELAKLFNAQIGKTFAYPKPVSLVKYLVSFFTKEKDIILDSFAGSGTTAHAVLDLNKEDGGNRKFILVEMEDYADKITAERVRRVVKKDKLDAGFTYCTLGSAIDAESLLSGKLPSYKEFAKYVYYLATGKNHPDESRIRETDGFAGKGEHESVYLLYKSNVEAMKKLAVTLDWAQTTHKKDKGKKIVYAPACYLDDEMLDQYGIKFVSIPYNLFERAS